MKTCAPGRNCAKLAVDAPPVIKHSLFRLPAGPGLGFQIDPGDVRGHTPKGEDWAYDHPGLISLTC